jgi:hypothetical protein
MADEIVSPQTEKTNKSWIKASGLLRDLATPLSVAIVGLLASVYVNKQQSADSNQRAFAELITQREAADTNLRIEMFKTVLSGFLKPGDEGLPDQILKLEILAYNFNESLDLGPLFQDVFRRVNANPANEQYRERLNRVAQDVVFKQVESLTFEVGVSKDAPVIDFDELKAKPEGLTDVINDIEHLRYGGSASTDHPERRFKLDVFARDEKLKELTVHLVVSPPGQTGTDVKPEVDVRFNVGYFDFPAINNTRLSNGERCAIIIRNMDESSAKLSLVYFPASRAGQKDRMNVEEILNQRNQLK